MRHSLVNLLLILLSLLFLLPIHTSAATNAYYEKLNTNWQFYEQQLLTGFNQEYTQNPVEVTLPVELKKLTGEISTYGTFVKSIDIPQQFVGKTLALEIPYVYGAIKVYANDELLTEIGKVGTSADLHDTNLRSIVVPVKVTQPKITLAVQLSSFKHIRGGFSAAPVIGDWEIINDAFERKQLIIVFFAGIVFIVGVYTTLIGLLARDEKILLTFGLFCIGVAIRAIFAVPFIYHELPFSISYFWATKIDFFMINLVFLLYVIFIYLLFKKIAYKPVFFISGAILVVLAILTVFTEPIIFQAAFYKTSILMGAFIIYNLVLIIKAVMLKLDMAIPLLIGIIFVFSGLIGDLLNSLGIVKLPSLSLFTISANVMLILLFLGKRFTDQLAKVKRLNKELMYLNQTLDEKIKERTLQLSEANLRLTELARKDGMTGIYNRHTFNGLLKYYFDEAVIKDEQLSLLIIDVDEFKKYNDTYGHVRGDELLKTIVNIINLQLPEDAVFARYGGEEFVIILPNFSKQAAQQIGETLRRAIKKANIEHRGREEGKVSISLGGVERTMEENLSSELQLIEIADKRLYYSKNNGRDCMTFHNINDES